MNIKNRIEAPPLADKHINSLRSMGYTTETALADIIDNSITAESFIISVNFHWNNGNCFICVSDDGKGMSRQELISAMTFSGKGIHDKRSANDLGRFGLGLKSASLSQARIMEVFSEKNCLCSGFSWNLNELENDANGKWNLLELKSKFPINKNGTTIIWRELDRIFTPGFGEIDFLNLIDQVEEYLGTVFHRFIQDGIKILINDKVINAINPVQIIEPYYTSPTEKVGNPDEPVEIKGYLYHEAESRLVKSGCLIYRGARLIKFGDWFDLKPSGELLKANAILSIDISNISDVDWQINIIKSEAEIPILYKPKIKKILSLLKNKVDTKKYSKRNVPENTNIWYRKNIESKEFSINESHSLISSFMTSLPEDKNNEFKKILIELERNVPNFTLNIEEPKEEVTLIEKVELTSAAINEIKVHILRLTKMKKLSLKKAKENLIKNRIFAGYENEIELIVKSMDKERIDEFK